MTVRCDFSSPSRACRRSTHPVSPSTIRSPTKPCSTRLSDNLRQTRDRRLIRLPLHINDAAFANALVQHFLRHRSLSPEGSHGCHDWNEEQYLNEFRDMVARRIPIVGGGAGTGLSAKCEEAGGIDLIIIYNSGRYRMAGRGSAAGLLAYGNANEIVKDMAREVLPVVKTTPVLAGVNGTDPFVLMPQFLAELKGMGFSGVQNFPTIGLFDGVMRASFEETGMGYALEVDMIAQAHALDLLTTPYVFNPDEARAMTQAGADIIVAHMGVTVGRQHRRVHRQDPGHLRRSSSTKSPSAALEVRKDVIVLCHGGPIAMPEDAAVRAQAHAQLSRILWREQHGAPADGDGAHRSDPSLQADRILRRQIWPRYIGAR